MITGAIKSQIDQIWNALESTYAHHMKDGRVTISNQTEVGALSGVVSCTLHLRKCVPETGAANAQHPTPDRLTRTDGHRPAGFLSSS